MDTASIGRGGGLAARNLTRRGLLKLGGGALALGASSALLAGCSTGASSSGATSASKGAKEISLWNFYGPSPQANPQSDWYVKTVADWNKTHDVKVNLKYVPNADYVQGSTLQTAFAGGEGPDIFIISPGSFLQYYNGGVLLDLTPYIKKDVRDDFLPGMLESRVVDGKIYAVPTEAEPLAIYYSKQAFSDAGITDTPKSWDDLLGVAKQLTNSKRFGLLFETDPGVYQNFTWYPYMWQGAGSPVNSKGKAAFDSDPVRAALGLWHDSVATAVAPRKALGTGSNDIVSNLGSGYCAMQECGSWAIEGMATGAKDFPYGIFPLPTPPGGKPTTIVGGWAFCANAKGKNPEAAAEFISWAVGSSSQDCVERCRNWDLVKSDPPVRRSVQKLAQQKGDYSNPELKYFVDQILPTGRGEPRYPPQVVKAISNAIQSAQLGGQSPASAAATAQSAIQSFMSTYHGAPLS